MNKKEIFVIILVIWIFSNSAFSQVSEGGLPQFIKSPDLFNLKDDINLVKLNYVDNMKEIERAKKISNKNCEHCKNKYYGKGIDVSIDLISESTQIDIEDRGKIWVMKVESQTAYGLQFYFDDFNIPKGGELFIFNENKKTVLGKYTYKNNPQNTDNEIKFGTQYIEGNTIYIEYFEPYHAEFNAELNIARIIHVFRNVFDKSGPFGNSGSCNLNVSCPEGYGWENEINSVALILAYDNDNELIAFCSGSLINNTEEDGDPLFLTANHCTLCPVNVNEWLFLFNHQTEACDDNGSNVSSAAIESVYGATLLSADENSSTSDYLLLRLNTTSNVLKSFGVCYAGWSLTDDPQPPFIGIHHPSGDVKKISVVENDAISTTCYGCTFIGSGDPNHWKVIWDKGTTEGGSSGSPLFNNNHKIIGQLHGGDASCLNPDGEDWYGKLSCSWEEGDLGFWLDPYNTGNNCIETYCPEVEEDDDENGGGYSSNNCYSWGGKGMSINGSINQSEVPCIDLYERSLNSDISDIWLQYPCDCDNCYWRANYVIDRYIGSEEIDNMPSYLDESLCYCGYNPLIHPFKKYCDCQYHKYFISMFEVDDNFNTISQEYTTYINKQMFTANSSPNNPPFSVIDGTIELSLNDLESTGIDFTTGNYYRLKLVVNPFNWKEDIRFFRYVRDEININENIDNSIAANKITIQNATITSPSIISAGEYIRVLPGSRIKAGVHRIEENWCDYALNFGKFYQDNKSNQYSESIYPCNCKSSEYNQNKVADYDGDIKIFPNPTNNYFNVYSKNKIQKIDIVNNLGEIVKTVKENKKEILINLSNLLPGTYTINMHINNKLVSRKILKTN